MWLRVNLYRKDYAADGMQDSAGKVRDSAGKVRDNVRDITDDKIDVSKLMESMTDQERTIYDAIKITGEITTSETEKLLNVKTRRAEAVLKNMADSDLIRKVGMARNTKYVLSES